MNVISGLSPTYSSKRRHQSDPNGGIRKIAWLMTELLRGNILSRTFGSESIKVERGATGDRCNSGNSSCNLVKGIYHSSPDKSASFLTSHIMLRQVTSHQDAIVRLPNFHLRRATRSDPELYSMDQHAHSGHHSIPYSQFWSNQIITSIETRRMSRHESCKSD